MLLEGTVSLQCRASEEGLPSTPRPAHRSRRANSTALAAVGPPEHAPHVQRSLQRARLASPLRKIGSVLLVARARRCGRSRREATGGKKAPRAVCLLPRASTRAVPSEPDCPLALAEASSRPPTRGLHGASASASCCRPPCPRLPPPSPLRRFLTPATASLLPAPPLFCSAAASQSCTCSAPCILRRLQA